MGTWFAGYFFSKGFSTVLSDVRIEEARDSARELGVELASDNVSAVQGADIALICVPIAKTGEVISEVAPYMRTGAVLAEISSIKRNAVSALRQATTLGMQPLSIHPMFGPTAEAIDGKTMIVVPVVDKEAEESIARNLFEGAEIKVAALDEHDRAMAATLSLTYFMNIAFAKVLTGDDLLLLKQLSGTTFAVQLTLAESVVNEDPQLLEALLKENPYSMNYIDKFVFEAENMKGLLEERDSTCRLFAFLKDFFERDPEFSLAEERRYKAFTALKG